MIDASNFAFILGRVIESRSSVLHPRLSVARDPRRASTVLRVTFAGARDTVQARMSDSMVKERMAVWFVSADVIELVDRVEDARIAIRDLVDQ